MADLNTSVITPIHGDEEIAETADPVIAKSVAMCVLFLASLTLGLLPIKLSRWFRWERDPKNNQLVILLLCFGGGVLFCTTFMHLLPEVNENIQGLIDSDVISEPEIHLAEFLMCTGFFVMYFVEEAVHWYLHRREKCNEMNVLRRSLSVRRGDFDQQSTDNAPNTISTMDLVQNEKNYSMNPDVEKHDHFHLGHRHSHDNKKVNCKQQNHENVGYTREEHKHNGHSHVIIEDSVVKSIRGLLIVLALSVHELFEGLAVGLEGSASQVWYMFGAVAAHKLVIAFCIGVELLTNQTKTFLIVIYVFTFAIVSPMGIGIGIGISHGGSDNTALPSVVLQGLASGTLLYVVFFEVLQKDRKGGIRQYLSVLIGFLVMFGLGFIGIGTGILLSQAGKSDDSIATVFLQGMAAGTLLYVVFFEVLAREKGNRHSGLWQLCAILAGFCVMLCLQVLTGHEHSHGGHSEEDHLHRDIHVHGKTHHHFH